MIKNAKKMPKLIKRVEDKFHVDIETIIITFIFFGIIYYSLNSIKILELQKSYVQKQESVSADTLTEDESLFYVDFENRPSFDYLNEHYKTKDDIEIDPVKHKTLLTLLHDEDRVKIVLRVAEKHNIEPLMIVAVIYTESLNNPYAISYANAKGLMQLMDGTFKHVARMEEKKDNMDIEYSDNPNLIFQPLINIEYGTRYLRYLYDKLGNWNNVFHAYNMGIGAFYKGKRNWGYANKIMDFWEKFKKMEEKNRSKVNNN